MQNNKLDIFTDLNSIPEIYRIKNLDQKEYLINGEIKIWNGETEKVYSPICLKKNDKIDQIIIGSYPLLSEKEAMQSLESAVNAYNNGQGEWPAMKIEDRIKCILDFTYKMKEQKDIIVNFLMWEIGKSLKDSQKEFDRTIEYIYDTIDAVKDLDRKSSRFIINNGIIAQIRQAPLGVVLCMGPFNYPLNETFTTLIPALIMGNTVIFKPAKYGVLLLRPLLEAFRDSFPKGVVNTIYGDGKEIITPIISSGKINILAFIGSSHVANIIEKQHPKLNQLKTIYGLGAKNPGIILDDADIDQTINECIKGALSYNGQRCTALKILFVHKKICDQFLQKLSDKASSLKIGLPWDDDVNITPLPEKDKVKWLTDFIIDAKKNGAEIVNKNGGESNLTVFFPAVVYPASSSMKLYHEEQFGPIIPVVPFDNIETPIDYILNSEYGQQVSIFSNNYKTIAKLIDPLVNQVCRVNINSQCQRGPDIFPFTGKKDSAEGTLSITEALREFSIHTLVAAKETDLNKDLIKKIIKNNESNFLSTDFIF